MVEVKIENILATSSLGVKLDLEALPNRLRELLKRKQLKQEWTGDVQYTPAFPGVILRLRRWLEKTATITIFYGGKLTCTGCRTEEEVKVALRRVLQILSTLPVRFPGIIIGKLPEKLDVTIKNITCSAKLGTPVGCGIVQNVFPEAKASSFGGGSVLVKQKEGTIRFFSSGSVTGVGFRSPETAINTMKEVIEKLRVGLEEYDSRRQEICKIERFDPAVAALRKYWEWLSQTRDISDEVYLEAHRILQEYTQKLIRESFKRTPEAIAAGALYIAAILYGESLTQHLIVDASGLTVVTIRNAYKDIVEVTRQTDSNK